MADAAVTFFLEYVQKLLVEHIHLVSGAGKELKTLGDELEKMKAFLDESNKREKGEVFRHYVRQIRDVVYEAEDTVETCILQAPAQKPSPLINFAHGKSLNLAREVKDLLEQKVRPTFNAAMKIINQLPIADVSATRAENGNDQKTPFLRQSEKVVGFDDEADTLIQYLREESEELEVISIIGMPGLGKTTLAWKIYHDPRIQGEFSPLIWVHVSQEFNLKDVFLTILSQLTQENISGLTNRQLAQEVRKHLEGKKFLLFIDDVWAVEDWKLIEAALPKSERLGKVLITTRDEKISWQGNCNREPHRLRFLTPSESWELLQLEVFGKLNECPSYLEGLGKHIAKQCGGVPLAILVIGGILVEKFSSGIDRKAEWGKVSISVSSYYFKYDKQKRTENIISLSCNNLPRDLRDCFLYLGTFPADTEIQAWKLIRLWIAEGFIKQNLEKSLEEVAQDNLKELVDRNLVMVDKTSAKGDVKFCHVHPMIHEFCQNEAGFEKQNLFREVEKSRGVFHPSISEMLKYRRLCIHSYVVDFLDKNPEGPKVRSLLCFSKEDITLPPDYLDSIPSAFKLLRVLDVNPIKFTQFPSKLSKLIHLKYIALSGDDFKVLPESISELRNLQTIRIDTMSREFEIKADVWKMMHLRHLKTKAAIILNKKVKGKAGENLQTLSRLSVQCCSEDIFRRATNLTNLGIRGQLDTLLDSKCMAKLDHLQKLKLVYDVHPTVTSEKPLRGLPHPDSFPPNLRILNLTSTFLDWKHMTTLGMLHNLEMLKLKENAFMGTFWEVVDGGFPSLEFLHIGHTNLEFWTASGTPFPKLRCLVLKYCRKLEEIPSALERSLQILDIECVTKAVVASARRIEGNKQQVQGQQRAKRDGFKLIIAPGDR